MKFSVIIPLYNKAPYVQKALKSVIGQTFRDFELIIVDDGSKDGSFQVAQESLNDSGLDYQLIQQQNAGVGATRNNGVAVSKGEYLCFLDADDWWAPTFLDRMNWLIGAYPDAGIYGTNYYYVKNGKERICVSTAITGYINYCKVYAEKLETPLWTGATCIPHRIFDEMHGFRPHLNLGEDFDLWIRIALRYRVAFLNEPLSYYFQDSDATWRLVGKLHNPESNMLWNLDYLSEEERTNPDYKRLIDTIRTYSLMPYLLSSQYREAAKQELSKVDWSLQPKEVCRRYRLPIPILKLQRAFLKTGSRVKQWIMKHL